MIRWIILLVVAGVGFALSAGAYEVRLEAVAGASLLVETPLIQGVKLEAGVPAGIDPLDLEGSPSYARLNIAGRGFIVLIDRTSDGARLYADANGDGKLDILGENAGAAPPPAPVTPSVQVLLRR